jgi:integrase
LIERVFAMRVDTPPDDVNRGGSRERVARRRPFDGVLAALDSMPVRIDTLVLFPAPRGGHIDLEKFRHREWTPALRAAGIDHRRVNDLRHTYASWSLAADVPVAKLSRMMGTSVAQIEDTYARALRGDEERYGSRLDALG